MADVSSELQDFRDRERLYNQKAVHQYMQNEQLTSIKWLLTMIFYFDVNTLQVEVVVEIL